MVTAVARPCMGVLGCASHRNVKPLCSSVPAKSFQGKAARQSTDVKHLRLRCHYTSEKARLGDSDDDLRNTLGKAGQKQAAAEGAETGTAPEGASEDPSMAFRNRDEQMQKQTAQLMAEVTSDANAEMVMPPPMEPTIADEDKQHLALDPSPEAQEARAQIPPGAPAAAAAAAPPLAVDENTTGRSSSSSGGISRGSEAESPSDTSAAGREEQDNRQE